MEEQRRPSWWSRNWKWALPVGCGTPVLLCAGLIGGVVFLVFGAMKSSDAYKEAFTRARDDKRVQAALGEPIKAGTFVQGNIEIRGNAGNANLTIPISGPKGSGKIHVVAQKVGGKWQYSTLDVTPENGERIDLLK